MNSIDTVQAAQTIPHTLPSEQSGTDTGAVPVRQPVSGAGADSYIPGDTPVTASAAFESSDPDAQTDRRQRDEFVPSPAPSPGVLYNVADIRRDPNGRIISAVPGNPAPLRGEQIADKIADIILSMGRKSLSIFRLKS